MSVRSFSNNPTEVAARLKAWADVSWVKSYVEDFTAKEIRLYAEENPTAFDQPGLVIKDPR